MRKAAWLVVRYMAVPFTLMGIGGTAIAMATAYFSIAWLEPAFSFLIWSGALGCIGVLFCMIIANFIKCKKCGNRALVSSNSDSEPGNTVAIYDSRSCHHCGERVIS